MQHLMEIVEFIKASTRSIDPIEPNTSSNQLGQLRLHEVINESIRDGLNLTWIFYFNRNFHYGCDSMPSINNEINYLLTEPCWLTDLLQTTSEQRELFISNNSQSCISK